VWCAASSGADGNKVLEQFKQRKMQLQLIMKLTIRKRDKLATSTGNSTGSRENEHHQQLADAAMRELLMEEEPEKAKGKGQGVCPGFY